MVFMKISSEDRTNAGTIWLLLSGVFAASVLLPLPASATGQIGHLPSVCLFYNLTGLPCPGCGLTRSFVCLGHGHLRESLYWHPLGIVIYGVFLLLWLRCGVYWLRGVTLLPLPPRTASRLGFGAGAVVLLTGIIRIGWLSAHHLRF
jgi:hypothetical protein